MAKIVRDVATAFDEAGRTPLLFSRESVGELRLAALLHDTGHGIFSHLSESLIEQHWYHDVALLKTIPPFEGKKAGEILSYMLCVSKKFTEFLDDVIARHNSPYDPRRIAGYILGRVNSRPLDYYKGDLITGPLDADKLDYIARDSYFTGIRSEVDIDQIIRSLRVWRSPKGIGRALVIALSGVSFVEQMHFARHLLFPAMYHHQKVRALECMVGGIFETIWNNPASVREPRLRFERITDLLRVSEAEFLTLGSREPLIANKIKRLQNRTLFRRALHISASVIKGPLERTAYANLVNLGSGDARAVEEIALIRREIFRALPDRAKRDSAGRPLDVHDVWLDIPDTPKPSKDISRCYVDMGGRKPARLRDLFPIDSWLQSYADNKWTAHVFGNPDHTHLIALNKAAISVLQGRFQFTLLPRASSECKLEHPSL